HFEHALHGHPCGFNEICSAVGGDELESHLNKATGDIRDVRFVLLVHADEHSALGWQFLAGGELGFREGFAEIVSDAHDLTGRPHLWPKHRIDAGKFVPRKHWRLHVKVAASIEIGSPLEV